MVKPRPAVVSAEKTLTEGTIRTFTVTTTSTEVYPTLVRGNSSVPIVTPSIDLEGDYDEKDIRYETVDWTEKVTAQVSVDIFGTTVVLVDEKIPLYDSADLEALIMLLEALRDAEVLKK